MPQVTTAWWKEATAYQIWPASFQDSNGDGYGDILGIISRLDYLKRLGIDLIWLSPVYDSPQHDMGYDIRNYEDIYEQYGTLADMEALIRETKARGMRIIMDLVVNHTSNQHEWFVKSCASRLDTNLYRDWYHWRDPKGWDTEGQPIPPNNWRAAFGGSVWTYSEPRKQFYLHLALPEQPDLNWFNKATRKAIYDSAIKFWLEKGVDGFRIDVVNFYWKDLDFPDAKITDPSEIFQSMEPQHILNGPLMHEWLQEQRQEVLEMYGDIFLVGELPATQPEEILRYISPKSRELDTIFDFDLLMGANSYGSPLYEWKTSKLCELKPALVKTQSLLSNGNGWPTAFLENHDNIRSIDRFGPGSDSKYRGVAAKTLALFLACLSGTLFLYQGQEIGMTNLPKTWGKEDFQDRATLRYLQEVCNKFPGNTKMANKALSAALNWARDNARTPVQWSSGLQAGFSTSVSWMRINENYTELNVESQEGNTDSTLEFWRRMLEFRKRHRNLLIYGHFILLDAANENKVSFAKVCPHTGTRMVLDLNFSDQVQPVLENISKVQEHKSLLISTYAPSMSGGDDVLKPWEGRAHMVW